MFMIKSGVYFKFIWVTLTLNSNCLVLIFKIVTDYWVQQTPTNHFIRSIVDSMLENRWYLYTTRTYQHIHDMNLNFYFRLRIQQLAIKMPAKVNLSAISKHRNILVIMIECRGFTCFGSFFSGLQ